MSKLKVNFIGDSHSVLTFGQTVLAHLESQTSVHFLAFSGMKLQFLTEWWLQKNDLKILNYEKKPNQVSVSSKDPDNLGHSFQFGVADVLIIALGTNDIVECVQERKSYENSIAPVVQKQLQKIARQKVFFIEPPLLSIDKDAKIRNSMLNQVRDYGFTIVSGKNIFADQPDGIHMKKDMAQKYGEQISKDLLKLIFPHH